MAETIMWIIADTAALILVIFAVTSTWKQHKALQEEIKEFEKRKHQG